jgi:hypothetical protein
MVKFFLLLVLCFGAFMALVAFLPSSTHTAFTAWGHAVPWFALGVCGVGFLGYKAIK